MRAYVLSGLISTSLVILATSALAANAPVPKPPSLSPPPPPPPFSQPLPSNSSDNTSREYAPTISESSVSRPSITTPSAPRASAESRHTFPKLEHPRHPDMSGNWYLRGDVGYAIMQAPDVQNAPLDPIEDVEVDNGILVGMGAGYRFNESFRADLTVDYSFDRELNAVSCACPTSRSADASTISYAVALLNGYFDIGKYYGFTPYIGAGAGVARVSTGAYENDAQANGSVDNTFSSSSSWTPAVTGMLGTSYEVAENIEIDGGYRLLWMSGAESGSSSTLAGKVEYENFLDHQVRLGLRYNIQ